MAQYERRILNRLLDSYENSRLSRGTNKVAVRIACPFTKKTMPEYFDESSLAYEEIHAAMEDLERRGFLRIVWKGGQEGHIITSVCLREDHADQVYAWLGRKPRAEGERELLEQLEEMEQNDTTPVVSAFLGWLKARIREGKTVKEFVDWNQREDAEKLIKAVAAIETNRESCYMREFSIRHFRDSKVLEGMLGRIGGIFRRFLPDVSQMDAKGILAEYSIYDTPDYVYLKGSGHLLLGNGQGTKIRLEDLKQGIGLCGEDLKFLRLEESRAEEPGKGEPIRTVLTIENQTTFFRWEEKNTLMIYLGGYHNSVRRNLLQKVYRQFPDADYRHFGDIDVGGFEIYEDLLRKTGIPFSVYRMGRNELEQYRNYTKPLTDHDRKRLDALLEKIRGKERAYEETLRYMKEEGVKLEQESIREKE